MRRRPPAPIKTLYINGSWAQETKSRDPHPPIGDTRPRGPALPRPLTSTASGSKKQRTARPVPSLRETLKVILAFRERASRRNQRPLTSKNSGRRTNPTAAAPKTSALRTLRAPPRDPPPRLADRTQPTSVAFLGRARRGLPGPATEPGLGTLRCGWTAFRGAFA